MNAKPLEDNIEDALESAMQAAQDFERGLLSLALRGELNGARIMKMQYALDGMRRNLAILEDAAGVPAYKG